jgi:hypothetical protein
MVLIEDNSLVELKRVDRVPAFTEATTLESSSPFVRAVRSYCKIKGPFFMVRATAKDSQQFLLVRTQGASTMRCAFLIKRIPIE